MGSGFDLVAFEGPIAGTRIALEQDAPNTLGRGGDAIHVDDPMVSIRHAELVWSEGKFWARDLQSNTGTFLEGDRLSESAKAMTVGSVLQVGETSFVLERRPGVPRGVIPATVLALGVLLAVGAAVWSASQPVVYEPTLSWSEPVAQGATTSTEVRIPAAVIRQIGADHRGLQLKRVSDFDANGLDELWLERGKRVQVWTFAPDGQWRQLGEVPTGCIEQEAATFPDLVCDGTRLVWTGAGWAAHAQEGAVVWLRAPVAAEEGEASAKLALGSWRVTLHGRDRFASFFAARGVTEPVHFLLCDGAIEGVPAQVLTASGRLVPLQPACLRDVSLSGPARATLGKEAPLAVAFTAVGQAALQDAVRMYFAGGRDEIFLNAADRAAFGGWLATPKPALGDLRLGLEGKPGAGDQVAVDGQQVGSIAFLGPDGRTAARPATLATLAGPGATEIDAPGCARLQVETPDWHCRRAHFCTAGSAFLRVTEVGCAEARPVLEIPFEGGTARAVVDGLELRARVDAVHAGAQINVLRTQIGWRALPPSAPAAP